MTELDLSPEEITQIVSFLGYGRPSAPVWFIGFDEGLGGQTVADVLHNLKVRAEFEKKMDLYEAHKRLHMEGRPIDFEKVLPSTQVWRFMAKIMLTYNGSQEWKSRKSGEAKEYIRSQLGRSDGETFLTELSPIPKKQTADKQMAASFKQKVPHLDREISRRKEELRRFLNDRDNGPSLVVCYGRTKARDFAELLQVEWRKRGPGIDASSDARCLLLPFFGRGHMSKTVIDDLLSLGLLGRSQSARLH